MLILPPVASHSAYPHELLKHVLVAQTVGNLNRKTSISAVCFLLRWCGNNSCCWKSLGKSCRTSWMGFQEKFCWPNITAPQMANPPFSAKKYHLMHQHQPTCCRSDPVGCKSHFRCPFWGAGSHLSQQQAGGAIRLSLIMALFETSHQGKMSFRSFCASCSLWASFTTETHQQRLYFSDSHIFRYWRLKLISETQEKYKTHHSEKCFILTEKKFSNYCKRKSQHSSTMTLVYDL